MFSTQKITLGTKIPFERIRLNGISTFTIDPELFQSRESLASIVKGSVIVISASTDVRRKHEIVESTCRYARVRSG